MVKHTGSEFRLLAARTFKKAVVNNKRVYTVFRSKRLNSIRNLLRQKGSKAEPVRLRAVQEPIKRIL